MARIFICGDTGQAGLLDEVASAIAAEGHEIVRGPRNEVGTVRRYSPDECAEFLGDADVAVFTVRHAVTGELMARGERLRGICFPVTGVETLDLGAAAELGIIVGHGAVRANVIGMAESTVMLMLMLFYDVEGNVQRLRDGGWRRARSRSRQLEGKTIGLVGFGRIAREVAERLAPFKVRILTHSPRARPEDLPAGVTKVSLDDLFSRSDLVSVLTGLTPETRLMIGRDQLAMMKRDAYIVNTGRGEVIDEDALYEHLRDDLLAGAALDTFTVEPLSSESPLRTLSNVILTPHCVGHTLEGAQEYAPAMVENIHRILAGELPLYCKNPGTELAWRERLSRIDGEAR